MDILPVTTGKTWFDVTIFCIILLNWLLVWNNLMYGSILSDHIMAISYSISSSQLTFTQIFPGDSTTNQFTFQNRGAKWHPSTPSTSCAARPGLRVQRGGLDPKTKNRGGHSKIGLPKLGDFEWKIPIE